MIGATDNHLGFLIDEIHAVVVKSFAMDLSCSLQKRSRFFARRLAIASFEYRCFTADLCMKDCGITLSTYMLGD